MSAYDGLKLDPCWRVQMLSERERQVLHHMMEGRSADEMRDIDCVSLTTIRSQIRSVLWKLGVNTQLQAVAYVRRLQCPDPTERRAQVDAVLVTVS